MKKQWQQILGAVTVVAPQQLNGFISMPLLGDIRVAGLTAKHLRDLLAERLGHFFTTPRVEGISP